MNPEPAVLGGVHAEGAAAPSSWADGLGAAALDPPATVVEVGAGTAVVDVGAGASVDVDAGAAVVGSGATVDEGTGASVVNVGAGATVDVGAGVVDVDGGAVVDVGTGATVVEVNGGAVVVDVDAGAAVVDGVEVDVVVGPPTGAEPWSGAAAGGVSKSAGALGVKPFGRTTSRPSSPMASWRAPLTVCPAS